MTPLMRQSRSRRWLLRRTRPEPSCPGSVAIFWYVAMVLPSSSDSVRRLALPDSLALLPRRRPHLPLPASSWPASAWRSLPRSRLAQQPSRWDRQQLTWRLHASILPTTSARFLAVHSSVRPHPRITCAGHSSYRLRLFPWCFSSQSNSEWPTSPSSPRNSRPASWRNGRAGQTGCLRLFAGRTFTLWPLSHDRYRTLRVTNDLASYAPEQRREIEAGHQYPGGPTLLASCSGDQLVEGRVETLVDYLPIRIRVEPVEDLARAECERNRTGEFRHQRLDFAVVEDHRMGLVPKKRWSELWCRGSDGVGSDVDQLRHRRPGGLGEDLVDPVPWQVLVGGDGEAVPDGLWKPKQPDNGFGEVAAVCQCPQGGAVPVYHHRLRGPHSCDVSPTAGQGNAGPVIGVGGPDDGDGEVVLAVGLDQQILAGDLVPRILPKRIPQGR